MGREDVGIVTPTRWVGCTYSGTWNFSGGGATQSVGTEVAEGLAEAGMGGCMAVGMATAEYALTQLVASTSA